MVLATEQEQEPDPEPQSQQQQQQQQQRQQTKKKKRTTGLASASAADVARVTALGQKARLVALAKLKAESDTPLHMGLAGATPEIRKKVARLGGLARAADKVGLAKAGKLGGNIVRAMYGIEHYREIGKKGAAVKESYSLEIISDVAPKRKKDKKKKNKNKDKA